MGLYVRMERHSGPEMPLYAASDVVSGDETFTVTGTLTAPTLVNRVIQAETYNANSGAKLAGGGAQVGYVKDGTWVSYDLNLTGVDTDLEMSFTLVGGSVKQGAVIHVLADGVDIGTVTTPSFGAQTITGTFNSAGLGSIATIKLVFNHPTDTGYLLDLDAFSVKYTDNP